VNEILKVGQSVEIKEFGVEKPPKYRVKIHEIVSDEEVVIEVPIVGNNALAMRSGTFYNLVYFEEASIYTQKVEVANRFLSGAVVCARLMFIGDPKKFNRRQYFRLPVLLDGFSRGGRNKFTPMTTTNLSAGGIRFVTLEKYSADQYIQIKISVGDSILDLVCKVVHCSLVQDSIRRYDVRAKFEQISSREEDLILKYLFEQQRAMKRKGLA